MVRETEVGETGWLRTPGLARWRALRWSLALAALLSGCCTNLDAVRRFAKTSAATADYTQIVADYTEAPVRLSRYRLDAPDRAVANPRVAQGAKLLAAQAILVDYLSVLGDLAADDLPNVDDDIDALSAALAGAGAVGDEGEPIATETADAAASIAKLLTRAVLDSWRRRQVRQLVFETDPHLQKVVAGLKEIVTVDLATSIDIEVSALELAFGGWQREAAEGGQAAARIAALLRAERLAVLRYRRERLVEYGKVLDAIGAGHTALLDHIDHLEGEALRKELKAKVKDLRALYKAIKVLEARG